MRSFLAITLALAAVSGPAAAQTQTRESTPFVIQAGITAGPAIGEVATAPRGQALIVQAARSIRAARLLADTPSLSGFGKVKTFPAGSPMFGIHTATGWAYCAVAETTASWWSGDEFVCYEDADADGRFETAMHSGAPFLGVPLFVFETGRKQPLPTPAPYSAEPTEAGPSVDYVVTASARRLPQPGGGTPAPESDGMAITLQGGFRQGVNASPVPIGGWSETAVIRNGAPTRITLMGAEFEILGVDADGTVRFRVISETPAQVRRITMGLTSTTQYVPIFIPG
ncbi:hypothetical protein [Brevundimonas subvibrioides]|uniref:Uncharacterized protein n=1 Tax=Brevundimonas subvibrioides (strain ATCC 15264 / DSM 4735 / LMG 14903 / NBRC 16000 / CB 81) TaxID=633149 RepID=D9QM55_BRESC|nr:hypothetical protein [Brevundimonas subvibrioides]ADL01981.1 hypothetical protein Bresu_2674 [Brevundimonas subvibrioides ATCC 15264]